MPLNERNFQEIRAKIAQGIQELPALPHVVNKTLEETLNENVSATTLERLIGSDQALATKTLRVVNSAYYGMPKQIESLSQAVVILGLQQLRNLALSISAMQLFKATSAAQREAHRQFWLHSIASASAAITLARKQRLPSHEQELAFVAGLLHDVGRLFLFTNFTEAYLEIDQLYRSGQNLLELEIKRFGVTHAQIGQVLAHVWKFPDSLADTMGDHEGPLRSDGPNLAMVVHAAHLLADEHLFDKNALQRLDPLAAQWLNGFDDQLFQIKNEIEAKVYAYEMLYGMLAA